MTSHCRVQTAPRDFDININQVGQGLTDITLEVLVLRRILRCFQACNHFIETQTGIADKGEWKAYDFNELFILTLLILRINSQVRQLFVKHMDDLVAFLLELLLTCLMNEFLLAKHLDSFLCVVFHLISLD